MIKRLKKTDSILFKIMVILVPVVIVFLIYFFRNSLIFWGTKFPACPSYTYLHVYCPGCGNTRSVQHFLSGDIAGSIRYNPIPVLGMLLLFTGYAELLSRTFKRRIKLVPRSRKFWTVVAVSLFVYFAVRNIFKIF